MASGLRYIIFTAPPLAMLQRFDSDVTRQVDRSLVLTWRLHLENMMEPITATLLFTYNLHTLTDQIYESFTTTAAFIYDYS